MRRFKQTALSLAIIAATVSVPAYSDKQSPVAFDIDSQSLSQAINQFAEQANIQVFYSQDLIRNLSTSGLEGNFSPEQVIATLLAKTGITYEWSDDNTLILHAEDEEGSDKKNVGKEDSDVDEEVVVTGTLLRNVNPASPMIVITVEDFERQGLNSAEDIVRSLPQNHASLNLSSSLTDTLLSSGEEGGVTDLQGNAAANLRGLGVQNTLVLINGRRTAGSPIFEGNFVNLSNVPFAAIERVEILLDGASSIYGADAVGGVINFIMKKGWTGSETAVRYENSDNGGHRYSLNQNFGTTWDGGDLTATIGYIENKRVVSRDAGWVTTDQTTIGGTDFRSSNFGSPGVMRIPFFAPPSSLPSTFDGTEAWTAADLSNSNLDPEAGVDEFLTPSTRNTTFNLVVNQQLTDSISAFADLQYAKNYTDSSRRYLTRSLNIMAGHPLNGLDALQNIGYIFVNEADTGLISRSRNETNQTQKSFTGGFEFELPQNWRLNTEGSWSESSSDSMVTSLTAQSDSLADRLAFAEFVGGVRLIENPSLNTFPSICGSSTLRRSAFVPVAADGSVACLAADQQPLPVDQVLNPFGNGTAQSQRLTDFVRLTSNGSPINTTTAFKATIDGALLELPGGTLQVALGTEYRLDEIDYTNNLDRTISSPFVADTEGDTNEPERSVKSVFADFSLPIIGGDQNIPGVHSLELQASVRWDEYEIKANRLTPGPEGTLDEASFSRTSPKVGFSWRPIEDLNIRGTWSEVFRAPDYSELLQPNNNQANPQVFDQWATNPDTGELMMVDTYRARYFQSDAESFRQEFDLTTFAVISAPPPSQGIGNSVIGGNPNLDPETGELITFGFDWTPSFIDGLTIRTTYTKSELENQIGTIGGDFTPAAATLLNSDVYVRGSLPGFGVYAFTPDDPNNPFNPNGTFTRVGPADHAILEVRNTPVNTGGFVSESVDFNIQYLFDTDWASWDTALYGTYMSTSERKPLPVSPAINQVSLINGIDQWVGTFRFGFIRENYGATMLVNYSSSYTNTRNNGFFNPVEGSTNFTPTKVEHYSTVDLTGHYNLDDSGWRLLFGARNVLNQHFPTLTNVGRPFDSSRVDVRGRIVYMEAKKTFDF